MSEAISTREQSALAECEEIIERGLTSFIEGGKAVLDTEDSMSPADFNRFCIQELGMHVDEIRTLLEIIMCTPTM